MAKLTGRVDGLERTVQTVLMIVAGRPMSTAGSVSATPAPPTLMPAGYNGGEGRGA